MTLSVIILSHNNEKTLDRALRSVSWADEIILVDDFSTDSTLKIAKEASHQIKIISHHLHNDWASQRNFALSQASGDWVLFLDSDEVITTKLQAEIQPALQDKNINGYFLKRQDYLGNRALKHGETDQVRLLRLAKRGVGQWQRPVHEYWTVPGPLGELASPLDHHPHETIRDFIVNSNHYSDIDAKILPAERFILLKPFAKFIYNYFILLGFLDGYPGFVFAYLMSLQSLMVRIKSYDFSRAS